MKTKNKLAVVFQTHKWDDLVDKLFFEMYYKLVDRSDIDIWIVAQNSMHEEGFLDTLPKIENIYVVDYNDYVDYNFFYADLLYAKAWQQMNWLIGLYAFSMEHQEYSHYMFVEPDVMFDGDWDYFMTKIQWEKYDFVHENIIQSTVDEEYWHHYQTLKVPFKPKDIYHSLISWFIIKKDFLNKMLDEISKYDDEFNCYGEILLPTMVKKLKAKHECVRTWFNVEVYPKVEILNKKMEQFDYDMSNFLLHPIKDMETYNKIKDQTKYIGNKRKI